MLSPCLPEVLIRPWLNYSTLCFLPWEILFFFFYNHNCSSAVWISLHLSFIFFSSVKDDSFLWVSLIWVLRFSSMLPCSHWIQKYQLALSTWELRKGRRPASGIHRMFQKPPIHCDYFQLYLEYCLKDFWAVSGRRDYLCMSPELAVLSSLSQKSERLPWHVGQMTQYKSLSFFFPSELIKSPFSGARQNKR